MNCPKCGKPLGTSLTCCVYCDWTSGDGGVSKQCFHCKASYSSKKEYCPFCLGHELKSRRMENTRQAAIIEAQTRLIGALDKHVQNHRDAITDAPITPRILGKIIYEGVVMESFQDVQQARADLGALMGGEK